ncbi:unnamed protein product [Amoebophrya sp. A25]|nr:unnamed protein product [Amoebophrya sp. A25]|eukprot:GSA25T00019042001.1
MPPLDLGDVFVLRLKDLRLDRVHSKCLLHATIVENWVPAGTKEIYATLIEDDNGDRMKLVVLQGSAICKDGKRLDWMQKEYPPGSRITLKEPWFKVLFDGTHGLRVEDTALMKGTVVEPLIVGKENKNSVKPGDDSFSQEAIFLFFLFLKDSSEKIIVNRNTCVASSMSNTASAEVKPETTPEERKQIRAKALQQQGNACVQAADFEKALELYELALRLDTDKKEISHLLYSNRALCFLKKKEYSRSLAEAERAIKLKPDFLKAYFRASEAAVKQGKYGLSIEILLRIPEEVAAKLTKIEEETVRRLLEDAAVLPTTPEGVLRVLADTDKQLQLLSPDYFVATVCEHTVRSCLLVAFQSGQRKCLDMPDEELDEVIDDAMADMQIRADAVDDLEKRKMVKEKIQQTAKVQEAQLFAVVPRLLQRFDGYEKWAKEKFPANEDRQKRLARMVKELKEIEESGKKNSSKKDVESESSTSNASVKQERTLNQSSSAVISTPLQGG